MTDTIDVPEGIIRKNVLIESPLAGFPDVLMDDTVYLMDDPVANMGGMSVIIASLPNGVILTKPSGR